ncbi:hypothetical protein ScalyP_jg3137 [Parmales sp. scaly parma]|nr:hypothetical protein ScalyP_jg3137 [Parmales sp. scaly parma]
MFTIENALRCSLDGSLLAVFFVLPFGGILFNLVAKTKSTEFSFGPVTPLLLPYCDTYSQSPVAHQAALDGGVEGIRETLLTNKTLFFHDLGLFIPLFFVLRGLLQRVLSFVITLIGEPVKYRNPTLLSFPIQLALVVALSFWAGSTLLTNQIFSLNFSTISRYSEFFLRMLLITVCLKERFMPSKPLLTILSIFSTVIVATVVHETAGGSLSPYFHSLFDIISVMTIMTLTGTGWLFPHTVSLSIEAYFEGGTGEQQQIQNPKIDVAKRIFLMTGSLLHVTVRVIFLVNMITFSCVSSVSIFGFGHAGALSQIFTALNQLFVIETTSRFAQHHHLHHLDKEKME